MKQIDMTVPCWRRDARQEIQGRIDILYKEYRQTYQDGRTPAETLKATADIIGKDATILTVAELINMVGAWDGRLYGYVRTWAAGIDNAATREQLQDLGLYQTMHTVHINQLGQAAMEM